MEITLGVRFDSKWNQKSGTYDHMSIILLNIFVYWKHYSSCGEVQTFVLYFRKNVDPRKTLWQIFLLEAVIKHILCFQKLFFKKLHYKFKYSKRILNQPFLWALNIKFTKLAASIFWWTNIWHNIPNDWRWFTMQDEMPVFCHLRGALLVDNISFLLSEQLFTESFDGHFHSSLVVHSEVRHLVKIPELKFQF